MTRSVCFLTTDSVAEGVGRSQIVAVLREVAARGWLINLVSFEKDLSRDGVVSGLLAESGVRHVALPFGERGKRAGVGRLSRLARSIPRADVYHCRSDVPFLAALLLRRSPLVWDCRSLWGEQRAAAGLIARGSATYRALSLTERAASRHADGMVTLSEAAVGALRSRWGQVPAHRAVIPTVTDLRHFTLYPLPNLETVVACFSGSFGPNYDPRLAESFLSALATTLAPLARVETTWTAGPERGAVDFSPPSLRRLTTDYGDLPKVISECHFGLVPIRLDTGISAAAMMPTKVGEFWACGRPIVVTRGVGDLDRIIRQHRVGIILDSAGPEELRARARDLLGLLRDPELAQRCRSVAEEYFDLSKGVDDLVSLYESLL